MTLNLRHFDPIGVDTFNPYRLGLTAGVAEGMTNTAGRRYPVDITVARRNSLAATPGCACFVELSAASRWPQR